MLGPARRRLRIAHRRMELVDPGPGCVSESLAQWREADLATGALEERSAHLPLQRLDHLGDPTRSEEQSLRCPGEVQLVGQDQKGLDLAKLHCPMSGATSRG